MSDQPDAEERGIDYIPARDAEVVTDDDDDTPGRCPCGGDLSPDPSPPDVYACRDCGGLVLRARADTRPRARGEDGEDPDGGRR